MSTVNGNNKIGHPVAGIVLGILGIAIALLMTLLFGVIAGAVAGVLGIVAALLGYSAHKRGNRGVGAIVAGIRVKGFWTDCFYPLRYYDFFFKRIKSDQRLTKDYDW